MAREKAFQGYYPCMILCAGTSKRFGGNKILAPLAGKPLLAHTIERVRAQVYGLAINGYEGEYGGFGLPVLPDAITGKLGPLAGILTAMEWAVEQGSSRVLTQSGDVPFVPPNWSEKLAQTPSEVIAIPQVDDQSHQVCSLWPVELAPVLRSFLLAGDSYKVRDFLASQRTKMVLFRKRNGIDPFFNVNTQEDMRKAEEIYLTSGDIIA